jgi:membrane-associated phospholipid phosphatase
LASLVPASAAAQSQPSVRALHWSPALDATVVAAGAGLWTVSESLKPYLAPGACRWCEADFVDADVREALVWHDRGLADTISDLAGFLVLPMTGVGLNALAAARESAGSNVREDMLLVAEAWIVAEDVTQLTKFLFGRERPFVHALAPDQKLLTGQPSDNNLSFISGHTSGAFAVAVASGTVATMRGYRLAPLVWSAGLPLAAVTGYLRIAADKHWLTDVIAGAVVGGLIGFALPYAFHGRTTEGSASEVSQGTAGAVSMRGGPAWTMVSMAW